MAVTAFSRRIRPFSVATFMATTDIGRFVDYFTDNLKTEPVYPVL
jgi:hypothetical protein